MYNINILEFTYKYLRNVKGLNIINKRLDKKKRFTIKPKGYYINYLEKYLNNYE